MTYLLLILTLCGEPYWVGIVDENPRGAPYRYFLTSPAGQTDLLEFIKTNPKRIELDLTDIAGGHCA